MGRYVVIVRWTPDTFRTSAEKWGMIMTRQAPKPVLDAYDKMKFIAMEMAYGNNCAIWVVEIKEEDLVEVQQFSRWMQDAGTSEIIPTISMEDAVKLIQALPPEQIFKKE